MDKTELKIRTIILGVSIALLILLLVRLCTLKYHEQLELAISHKNIYNQDVMS